MTPIIEFGELAFPSQILATATIQHYFDGSPRMITRPDYNGDIFGNFGAQITVSGKTSSLRLEIEGDRFIKNSTITAAKIEPNRPIELFPLVVYDYRELEALTQPTPVNITFRVYIGDAIKAEEIKVIQFRSVNEVPILVASRFNDDDTYDYTWLFASFVNEDNPLIDQILKNAAAQDIGTGNEPSFGGYQGSSDDVMEQVFAIWNVFQSHGIKYSDITGTSAPRVNVISQYVRTLTESFNNNQANCVDGSVLFASVLQKIGIDAFLTTLPGHMMVGFYIDNEREQFYVLETTMLNNFSFSDAIDAGSDTFISYRDEFFDGSNLDYQMINIRDLRDFGVMPIHR
jgi:hypothetical protein